MEAPLVSAWSAPGSTHFTALELVLPGATVRLVSGGFVSFDVDGEAQDFDAEDAVYGTLAGVAAITDGVEVNASAMRIQVLLLPPSAAALASLTAPTAQGSAVRIWQGAVSDSTGLAVEAPELLFEGVLDFGRLSVDQNSWAVALECGTEEELQLEPDAQRRLSDQFHRMVWPGEYGLKHVTNTTRKIYWRLPEPRGASAGGGSVGGGRGGSITNVSVFR